ncbi:MAG: hypothetical protein R3344_12680 [Acidobacteriota bacterium]|nr:hypothetical protein [Acidobacteriota bacterium]
MPYQSLNPEKITATVRTLHRRIQERFPDTGLAAVCGELVGLAEKAGVATDSLTRPMIALRFVSGLLAGVIVAGLGLMIFTLSTPEEGFTLVEFVQTLEAGINDVVLIGVGIFFLVSIERRLKRRKVLSAISELRSIAHIIDMHQLTKDPQHALRKLVDTPASPRRVFDREALSRYLDYCSEMLSLTGKIAALYVQKFDDSVVLASVNEVEALTTGLSGKIWQKLVILETGGAPLSPTTSAGSQVAR